MIKREKKYKNITLNASEGGQRKEGKYMKWCYSLKKTTNEEKYIEEFIGNLF